MSQAAIIIDLPNQSATSAPAGSFITAAEEAVARVRRDFAAEAPVQFQGKFTSSTTTTDSDPGAATIRFNAADQRAATKVFVDDADAGSKDWAAITARVASLPTDVKAILRIQNAAHPENFVVFTVTSVTDASGYNKLNGTVKSYGYLADAGTTPGSPTVVIANSTAVLVSLTPENQTRASASLDSIVAGSELSALTDAEIAADVAAGVLVAIAAVETLTVAGAAAGNVTVTGIAVGDVLVKVFKVTEADPPTSDDLTAEFTVTATNTINNVGGTSSAGESLIVVWYTP